MANDKITFDSCTARLVELEALEPGWLAGEGDAIDKAALEGAQALLATLAASNSPFPRIYPTSQGGVHLEWHREGMPLEITVNGQNGHEIWMMCDGVSTAAKLAVAVLESDSGR